MKRDKTPGTQDGVWWLPWLIVVVGAEVYLGSLSGAFIFDDFLSIVENPRIRSLWPLWDTMSQSKGIAVAGRPLVVLSLKLNYALGGLHVWGYHVFNVMVHLLAALLLFGVVRRTLTGARLRGHSGREAPWLALSVALLWMVHPLLTESVTYIIQRTELLMGLFMLCTLYCVIRGSMSSHPRRWYAAAVASCVSGMASKEVMVSAPLLVWLYDRTCLSASFRAALRRRRGLYIGLAASWLMLAALVAGNPREGTVGFAFKRLTAWDYAKTQCGVLVHYLKLAFWPHPLVIDYADWPIARTIVAAAPSATVVAVLLVGTLWALRRKPALGFLGAWFFLILAPTSSVLPIITEMAAERRMYLPLCAVMAVMVMGGWELLRRVVPRDRVRRHVAAGFVMILVAALSAATVWRNEDYRSEASILMDTVAKRPRNARAHANLGVALSELGDLKAAIAQYTEAIRLKPNYALAHNNLGSALADVGRLDEAIAHYTEALRLTPDYPEAHNNLGTTLFQQGRVAEAIRHYETALRLKPDYATAHSNLGNALADQGRLDEAIVHYAEAVRLQPDYAEAHNSFGTVLFQLGHVAEAISHYEAALRLKPDYADARHNLGIARASQLGVSHGDSQQQ